MLTLKAVFDHLLRHLVIDQSFARKLYNFQVGFVNKTHEHMDFFGGNLTGVHRVRFTDADFAAFYDLLGRVDGMGIRAAIEKVPTIDENRNRHGELFKVSSDPFNLTCMYLIHRCLTSPKLTPQRQVQAAIDLALIFNYRALTALLAWYFRYPADPKVAQATYASLSNRFLIKKLGSWQAVLVYRSQEFTKEEGLWYQVLKNFGPDEEIVKMVNDTQGRVRDILKSIFGEHVRAKENDELIYTQSSTMLDVEGVEVVRDRVHGLEAYLGYLSSILPDRNSFIKTELVQMVTTVSYTTQINYLVKTLEFLSDSALDHKHKLIHEFIHLVLTVSFNYLTDHQFSLSGRINIPEFLIRLKGCYTSAKSKDPDLEQLRAMGTQLVHQANGRINDQSTASTRTAVFLYVALRAYVRQHYSR
jgi:hypothetical protein